MRFYSLLLCVFLSVSYNLDAKAISFTFNDQAGYTSKVSSPLQRTRSILHTLKENKLQAAFFFSGTRAMSLEGRELLELVDGDGHFIGNNSYGTFRASSKSLEEFKQQLFDAENALSKLKNYKKWFRYPYLDYGNRQALGGSDLKRRQIADFLSSEGYCDARISINTLDWYIDKVVTHEHKQKRSVDQEQLKKAYITMFLAWANYYEQVYSKLLNEPLTHSVVLIINDLNMMFLPAIIKALKEDGWEIRSPQQSYSESWVHASRTLAERYNTSSSTPINPPYLSIKEVDSFLSGNNVFTTD